MHGSLGGTRLVVRHISGGLFLCKRYTAEGCLPSQVDMYVCMGIPTHMLCSASKGCLPPCLPDMQPSVWPDVVTVVKLTVAALMV
jgi:hypothetical protein